MTGVLDAVVAAARTSARERERADRGAAAAAAIASTRPGAQAFRAALTRPGVRVIAECKRRSPSRGVLRAGYDAAAIARAYEDAGAAAVSVLTEPTFFDGSLADLVAASRAVAVPLLRKDFLVTDFQLIEARAAGASAVLLIAAALDDAMLTALLARASALDLAALVEVHDRSELDRALAAGAAIVGVNSRNLRTLEVSLHVFDALAPAIPPGVIAVAESGIRTAADLRRLSALRYDAFLVGERLVTETDPGAALGALLADAAVSA